jgi:hypothetical protein
MEDGHCPPYREMAMTRGAPALKPQFDQRSVLLAKQELVGNCVPKQELGNEKIGTS